MRKLHHPRQHAKENTLGITSVFSMAGRKSSAGNPLFTDFTLVGQELEYLGFTYQRGEVLLIDILRIS